MNTSPINVGGPSSPPPAPGVPAPDPALLNASARNAYHAKPNVELSSNSGQILLAYPSVAQLWSYSEADAAFCISGSTFGVNGKIITAHFIPATATRTSTQPASFADSDSDSDSDSDENDVESSSASFVYDANGMLSVDATRNLVLLQVLRKDTIYLEIHQLNKKPSFVKSLVLPPASSGPGPYSIYSKHTSSSIAVVTTSGVVTLFSVPQFLPLPLSGLETRLNPEGIPLFDMSGRWLAYSPTSLPNEALSDSSTCPSSLRTPLKLPPPGQALDRLLENISTTTASSLKSISDAGVAGLRHYLSSSTSPHGTTLADEYAKKQQANIVLVGNNKFCIDSSGKVALAKENALSAANSISPGQSARIGAGVSAAVVASLPNALSSLFQTQANSPPVQIIDVETQKPICTFIPPQGLSHLSLSPYTASLATVSSRGESIFTFDLSFIPLQVSLSGKYVRGVTPAKVHHVEWDTNGGFGIITRDKGSVHWFERQPWNTYESLSMDPRGDDVTIDDTQASSGSTNFSIGSTASGATSLIKSKPFNIFANINKKWKLSGWNVQSMMLVSDKIASEKDPRVVEDAVVEDDDDDDEIDEGRKDSPSQRNDTDGANLLKETKYSNVVMLREGQLLVVSVASGAASWKYDLPWHPVAENFLTPEIGIEIIRDANVSTNGTTHSSSVSSSQTQVSKTLTSSSKIHPSKEADNRLQLIKMIEPLAFFELHPCLPYPLLHTDRHIILATYDAEEESSDDSSHDDDDIYYPSSMFGLSIEAKELDFGRAKGQVQFSGASVSIKSNTLQPNNNNTMSGSEAATSNSGSEDGTPLLSDVDERVLQEMDSVLNSNTDNTHNSEEHDDNSNTIKKAEWSPSKAAELELAMQSMVVFEKHEDDEDALMIVT